MKNTKLIQKTAIKTKMLTLVLFAISLFCFSQSNLITKLEPNFSKKAKFLIHELNKAEDTLFLKAERGIEGASVISHDNKKTRYVSVDSKVIKIPMYHFSEGRYTVAVYCTDGIIAIAFKRIKFIVKPEGADDDLQMSVLRASLSKEELIKRNIKPRLASVPKEKKRKFFSPPKPREKEKLEDVVAASDNDDILIVDNIKKERISKPLIAKPAKKQKKAKPIKSTKAKKVKSKKAKTKKVKIKRTPKVKEAEKIKKLRVKKVKPKKVKKTKVNKEKENKETVKKAKEIKSKRVKVKKNKIVKVKKEPKAKKEKAVQPKVKQTKKVESQVKAKVKRSKKTRKAKVVNKPISKPKAAKQPKATKKETKKVKVLNVVKAEVKPTKEAKTKHRPTTLQEDREQSYNLSTVKNRGNRVQSRAEYRRNNKRPNGKSYN